MIVVWLGYGLIIKIILNDLSEQRGVNGSSTRASCKMNLGLFKLLILIILNTFEYSSDLEPQQPVVLILTPK